MWTRIERDQKQGCNTEAAVLPAKRNIVEDDEGNQGGRHKERKEYFMTKGKTQAYWRRLFPSPARSNESPVLELSRAWELGDRSGAWRFNPGTRSFSCVLGRNMVEKS